ncbi:WD40-repeat-containing domain protein [Kickxella alabastrina]|uniref:WD40-repeat-containing domain protein n=1 Tax=Kickxella alabastrina TaxID=61397 RepID=UPI00221E3C07|nr:WD40-repeat-containing domain protein [Kickxella alabastrina]KAI7833157.1 WD40-repeat-containing domain protein [Kickxella alabastrina]
MSIKKVSTFKGHRSGITALTAGWDSRSTLLLSGSDDGTVRLWDARIGKSICAVIGFPVDEDISISGIGFVGDHELVAACGPSISIYDHRALKVVNQTRSAAMVVIDNGSEIQALSTRGDFAAFVDEDGSLGVCDTSDVAPSVDKFSGNHDALASCVGFHPDRPEIASGGFDQQVFVWDMAEECVANKADAGAAMDVDEPVGLGEQRLVNPPFVYSLDYWSVDEAAEGRMLASGHADGSVMCIRNDAVFCWSECHDYSISALQFVRSRPDVLVTVGLDRTIRLWDAESMFFPEVEAAENYQPVKVNRELSPLGVLKDLSAKPDTVATSDALPHIFTDERGDIVAYAFE